MGGGGCQSKSYLKILRVQCGEGGIGRRKSGAIAYVQSDVRAFDLAEDWKSDGVGGRCLD